MTQLKPLNLALYAALCSGAFALSAPAALAQDANDKAEKLNRVEVTGSSIKRIAREGALPVQIYNRADIEKTGATNVADLVQKLPSMQLYTDVTESVGGGGGGISTANIHGVGEQRTLVLINGRRLATYGLQTLTGGSAAIDLNTLPLSAIENVEVLTDGASAIYGSDAIAGVVNFITRHDFQGAEVSAGFANPRAGAKEVKASVVGGFGSKETDGYNVMFALSHDTRSELKATDRKFATTGILNWTDGSKQYEFFNGSSRSIPANVSIGGVLRNPYLASNGVCPDYHVQIGQACYFDYTSTVYIYPETKRSTFMASGEWAINDNHTLFADFLYGKQNTISKIAPPPVELTVNPGDAAYSHVAPLGATGPVVARWRVMDAGNRTTDYQNVAYQVAAGSKGRIADWDYHTSLTYSISKAKETHLAGWLKGNELVAALGSGTLDPFVGQGEQSAAGMAALNSAVNRGVYKEGQNSIAILEARASKPIFALAGGDASLGAGADIRYERTRYNPSNIAQGIGNVIAGDTASEVPFDVTRNAIGAFAELAMPVLKSLEVTTALRADHYSDFGNTVNGKLSARWTPVQQFMMRGSVGTGFHAPTVAQVSGPTRQSYGVTGGTYDCKLNPSDPLYVYCPPADWQYDVVAGANPNLKPEKSQQWTLGFRVEPANWLSAGLDVWNIKVKDRIGQLAEDTILNAPNTYRNNITTFTDPLTGETRVAIYQPNENLGNSITRGIDFDIRTRFNTGMGRISSNLIATYMLKDSYQRLAGGAYYSDLGKYSDDGVVQRLIARWSTSLQSGGWTHTVGVNYKSGYWDQPQDVYNVTDDADVVGYTRKVKPFVTLDLQTSYKFKWNATDISATLGVLNVANKAPPFSIKTAGGHQLGFDNRYADPRGRTIYGTLTAKF